MVPTPNLSALTQDALTKSIKVKRKEIDDGLRARSDNDHKEVAILE